MVRLFVDINSKQKRIDINLIQDLKADFAWDPDVNYRQHTERIIVQIARAINDKGPLRQKIFMGGARETRGDKITLATFVSVIKDNQLVGGVGHFWNPTPKSQDIDKPLKRIKSFFSTMLGTFAGAPDAKAFLLSNVGLRIVFRVAQILERNRAAGTCKIPYGLFLKDLRSVLSKRMIASLKKLYGIGGKVEGAKKIVNELRDKKPHRYTALEHNLRKLKKKPKAKSEGASK